MFELTIKTDNPAILRAIAKAVENTPPVGYEEGKPVEVNVHASLADMKDATANVNLAENAKVKEHPTEEPIPLAKPVPDDDLTKARGQQIRKLLLAVSKLEGQDIQSAKRIAADAAGIDSTGINKDFPSHPKADAAIEALEAALNG